MNKTASKAIKYILSFVLAGVLVFLAFRGVDWSSFWGSLGQTQWGWIALFLVASVVALVFRMLRWQSLLRPLGGKVGSMLIWDANNVGNLANVVIPGSGEFIRGSYLSGGSASFEKVLGTEVVERICDFLAVFVLFGLALVSNWTKFGTFFRDNILAPAAGRAAGLIWAAAIVAALIAGSIWAVWHYRERYRICRTIADKVSGFWQGFIVFLKMKRKWVFLLYTACIWASYVAMSYCIIRAIPDLGALAIEDALFLSAVGNIASVIPVPGGVGAYHYLVSLTLASLYGVPQEVGLLNATLNHEIHAVLIIVLGIISYVRLTISKKK